LLRLLLNSGNFTAGGAFEDLLPPGQSELPHPKTCRFSIKTNSCSVLQRQTIHQSKFSKVRNAGFAALLLFGSCMVKDDTLQGLSACGVDDLDTTLLSGKYVDFFLNSDSTLMMSWGSAQYGNQGAHEYGKWPVYLGLPRYICEFDEYIAMRESCGSPCWNLILLPVIPGDSIVVLQEDLLQDTNRGYVFGNRCHNEDSAAFCLYDVNHRMHHPITLPGLEWASIEIRIDSCAFVKEGLFLRWNSWKEAGGGIGSRDTVISL
jgi:hypothetical protein